MNTVSQDVHRRIVPASERKYLPIADEPQVLQFM
jgi:hypothetical protein